MNNPRSKREDKDRAERMLKDLRDYDRFKTVVYALLLLAAAVVVATCFCVAVGRFRSGFERPTVPPSSRPRHK